MAVNSNLYPPIVDTYMPAFLVAQSVVTSSVTKTYNITSYQYQEMYEANVDEYIDNCGIDGVEELWVEYEQELAELRSEYDDPDDPELIEAERQLKISYDAQLVALISDSSNKTKIEETFFAEQPGPITITKTATFDTLNTTNEKFICRLHFSLSPYNTLSEIANAQVTIRSQLTNKSVLHKVKYPSEIMLKAIQTDLSRDTRDKYYIEIKPEDLEGNNFTIDEYYKVQIRFTSTFAEDPGIDLTDPGAIQPIDSWLTRNLRYFSEWSTVCLIRGISIPALTIKDFNTLMPTEIYDTVNNTQIIGKVSFADENETEILKSYRIKLYENSNNTLLLDSGEIYSNQFTDINNFVYQLQYWFQLNHEYYFTLKYTTQNLYIEEKRFDFIIIPAPGDGLNATIEAIEDEDNGRIGLHIERSSLEGSYTGDIVIRRASNKNNYSIWEDIYTATFNNVPSIDFTWYDYTIESGIFYLYAIQGIDLNGGRTGMIMIDDYIMLNFEDIFLTTNDKQLKIKFNPNLNSFKRTVSEVKIDTIGSQYPFIKRNGAVNYVQFPLGGLITSAMDKEGLFTTKNEVFGNSLNDYIEYNEENNIPIYQDVIWEKMFRNKVEKFLYDDNVKLFRSPTEGNFLIKLMDINFQPNQTLGRRLWSFSSMAYEIDECNLNNYNKYNIYINNNGTIIDSGGSGPSTLLPIQRIIIINSPEEFPVIGQVGILYLFENQFYLWDSENNKYFAISVPWWNEEDPDFSLLTGVEGSLYTDGRNLYKWNTSTNQYDIISVPSMEG